MFKQKVKRLINEFHIKKVALINLIGSNKVTFEKKLSDNSFTEDEKSKILNKYGSLL